MGKNIFAIGKFAIKSKVFVLKNKKNKKIIKNNLFCRCLHYFNSNNKLEAHSVVCREMNDCGIRLPSNDVKWLSFSNHNRKERVPFIIYADLECILEKTDSNPKTSQHHRVFSIGYYVRCSYDESLSYYQFRRDKDCIAWFVDELKDYTSRILSVNVLMETLSSEQWDTFCKTTQYHVCEKPFASDEHAFAIIVI